MCMPLHCQRNGPTGSSLDRPGARRAVTCATITSNKALGAVAGGNPSICTFRGIAGGLRIIDERLELVEANGREHWLCLQCFTTWTQQKTALRAEPVPLPRQRTPRRYSILPSYIAHSLSATLRDCRDGTSSTSAAMGH